jgi:acetoin utilization deacetylase AcuC-like enzyme
MTLVYGYPASARHITPPGHPERVDRLDAVEQGLLGLGVTRRTAPLAAESDLLLCHPAAYVARIRAAEPTKGISQLMPSAGPAPPSTQF